MGKTINHKKAINKLMPFNGKILNSSEIKHLLTGEEDLYSENTRFSDYNFVKYKLVKRVSYNSYLIDIPIKLKYY